MQPPTPPAILGLLGDPLRWQIVDELGRSDRRVGELVTRLGRPQNVVSYHLAELRRTGLVSSRRSSADGRDTYYRVDLTRCRDSLAAVAEAVHPGLALTPARRENSLDGRGTRADIGGLPCLLFLCTGNSARSQIAEALALHHSDGQVRALSAGSAPKPLHPNAVRVLAERGIDVATNSTKPLTRFIDHRFDRVVTLCDKVREICPEFPGAPRSAHWSIADPASAGPDDDATTYPVFVDVANDIEHRVLFLLADLATNPTEGIVHA